MTRPFAPVSLLFRTGWLLVAALSLAPNVVESAVAPTTKGEADVVRLPPFMVTTDPTVPWLYGRIPEFEILSRASEADTTAFIQRLMRSMQLLHLMVPDRLHAHFSIPQTMILTPANVAPSMYAEVLEGNNARKSGQNTLKQEFLPNMFLRDSDWLATFSSVQNVKGGFTDIGFTPAYIRQWLEQRTPQLPPWFIEGVVVLYQHMDHDVRSEVLQPLPWRGPREPLPMEEVLGLHKSTGSVLFENGTDPAAAQAAMFIRWALDGTGTENRNALWRYVERASAEPPSEELFKECFGEGYAQMRERLRVYLPRAVSRSLRLTLGLQLDREITVPALRVGTPGEIARIKGDWERLVVNNVRASNSQFAPRYIAMARDTFTDALERGEKDPRFLAAAGLFESDQGNESVALPLLESAARSGAVGPRVSFEIARIRIGRAADSPDGQIDPAQLASILDPLRAASEKLPVLAGTYQLAAEVFLRCSVDPTREQLDWFEAGLKLFPRDFGLLLTVALMEATHGLKREANAHAARGLTETSDPSMANRFEKVLTALRSIKPATP